MCIPKVPNVSSMNFYLKTVCKKPPPAMNIHCQNSLPKYVSNILISQLCQRVLLSKSLYGQTDHWQNLGSSLGHP